MATSAARSNVLGSRAAILAAAICAAIAVFQAALALGAPLGMAAWGGANERLSSGLRIASACASAFWFLAGSLVLARVGLLPARLRPGFIRGGVWALAGVSALGAVLNFASSSNWERFLWGPLAAILAVLCIVVARNDNHRT